MKALEISEFSKRNSADKMRMLVRLAYEVSVGARGTYAAGTNAVSAPEQLREFMELIHRILDYLCTAEEMERGGDIMSDEQLVNMLNKRLARLPLDWTSLHNVWTQGGG